MSKQDSSIQFFVLEDFVPGLKKALEQAPLDFTKLVHAAAGVSDPDAVPLTPARIRREMVGITDGTSFCTWDVASLTELFRGDKVPPTLGAYPQAYEEVFVLLEFHVLEYSRLFGNRRDEEMLETYAILRRRPDGKSLGTFHDYMWQAAALILATRILSQAEFEAILSRLERSCRTFRRGPTSRNYVASLQQTLGQTL